VQVLCKAANLSWPAVKALIMLRTSGNGMSTSELDDAYANLRPACGFDHATLLQVRQANEPSG
jgi:hypothetical protein